MVELYRRLSILVVVYDINHRFRSNSTNFWQNQTFQYKIKIRTQIWVQIWIEIVATIDQTAGIESQKSITSQFEYDLDRNFAGGDRICLAPGIFRLCSEILVILYPRHIEVKLILNTYLFKIISVWRVKMFSNQFYFLCNVLVLN